MSRPCSAPLPVPTMMAMGVARPMAQGQAMTSTATAAVRALAQSPGAPTKNQPTKVARAIPTTMGTKTAETLSTSRWMGALPPWASCTSRMICASAVSAPTRRAVMTKAPVLLRVAPMTGSPSPFCTGRLSPVSIDSSTLEWPLAITPSAGTRSPGRTRSWSPTLICSTGMSDSWPSTTRRAVLGLRPIRRLMAAEALPLARASRYLPRRIRVMITAAVS
ncbi:hypothetical protein D3C86_1262210 [compost metagenome]